ncbi:UNVERIFIED_CONTAM: putative 1-acyl-sn-glycerol-3-phosphate acyltransferase 5 [Sesamum calycinum]|uniref:1-acyl-sn-glycerol-3-phosphate acyltransferase 5 n=1 Tax=Sesamum calycinum TaxID=2727403 RepID=A0AAW2R7W3_9LAMI
MGTRPSSSDAIESNKRRAVYSRISVNGIRVVGVWWILERRYLLSTFRDPRDPLWLAVFPEGTDFTEQKCLRSQKYASENGLPHLKNVLLPKTKGFYACLEHLRGSLDAVYDITIGYQHRCPSFLDNAFGVDPSEVHHPHPTCRPR